MLNAENELKKWAPVLEHADAPAITDSYKKAVTARLLENTELAIKEQNAQAGFTSLNETSNNAASGGFSGTNSFDPILISLVRRAMPNLIAYDVAGVQPMSGPTGLIFSMNPKFGDGTPIVAGDDDAFLNEPDTTFSGTGTQDKTLFTKGETQQTGTGQDTAAAEAIGAAVGTIDVTQTGAGADAVNVGLASNFAEMGFTIEKSTVTAKTRQLKAEYTMELAQDLKAVHGLDAESELANILSGEILGEINREVIRNIVVSGKFGGQIGGSAAAGIFDMVSDADGRWAVEKFQSLVFKIEAEANWTGYISNMSITWT